MTTLTFDTHQFIQTLQEAGFEPKQAEGLSRAIQKVSENAEYATKQDIDLLKRDIRESELRLEAKISDIKFDLVKWMAGMLLAQAALVATLVKLL